jgi:hypothetical protein
VRYSFVHTAGGGFVDIAPVWRTPHQFSLLPVDGHAPEAGLQPVFTYALLSTELAQANLAHGLPPEAVSRIGIEWLASLADQVRGGKSKSALTTFLEEQVGIAHPGQDSNKAVIGGPHATSIPAKELEAFIATELPRIRHFVDFELRPFLPELAQAADERRRPDAGSVQHAERNGLAAARRLLTIYGPRHRPVPMRSPRSTRPLWGLEFQNLAERISVELFEIFATRPRLHRCRLCGRIFVPRTRTDSRCRAYLWAPGNQSALDFCIPQHEVDAHNADVLAGQHERERKRLHQQMRRRIKRYGEGSEQANSAIADYQTWITAHGKQRGPAPRPMPGILNQTD